MDGLGLVQRLLLVFNDPGTCFFIVFVCDAHIFGLPKKDELYCMQVLPLPREKKVW
jgi:hypothetical protein